MAEIVVTAGRGRERHGSGYRVHTGWILTSAQLLDGAQEATVWVGLGSHSMWTSPALVALASDRADVALLKLTGVAFGFCSPPAYGTLTQQAAPVPFTALGYTGLRISGTVKAPSDDRGDTLELAVDPLPAGCMNTRPDRWPWEGMSGAAVWHDDLLIGLVGGAHRGTDGPGHLTVTPVDRWYALLTASELDLLHEHAGLPPSPTGRISLAALPENLPLHELDGLVTALTLLPCVSDRNGLALVLDSIDPVISAMSPRSPALRPDVFGIVRTCLRYRGTLDQLLEAIRLVEGESVGVVRMDQEAVELSRRHR
ncbi:hypothetical protein BN159_4857 [Streptomyces davaonensis JCM 4913]|uniref:Effector-associated domain-containing protein n=1 Tax=Streptomyces davaonensis (strain DSM 101723 / JCM 4913 / KCC S-0913 / 768) TaxID=1214101 RepID=K4QYW4_STRDJ|nr:trypsin-like peptidase domain-containing protein [Streptomyces davaonensis]CCK29236.1 hypothetical protein BN159_4857 [Streptomyces davaonensis JCM 4913]